MSAAANLAETPGELIHRMAAAARAAQRELARLGPTRKTAALRASAAAIRTLSS